MTKWNLPEGRKPLTDEDMAELTRRLADTAIEHSELYQAAKRDAEEAEAYAASLESDLNAVTEMLQKSRAVNVALEAALEAVEKERDVARKLEAKDFELLDSPWKQRAERAEAALATARREALEEAAKVARGMNNGETAKAIAKQIRALPVPTPAEILAQIEERGE